MRIYDKGVRVNIEDVDFGKVYNFTISNDEIEFNIPLNVFLNIGEDILEDYLLSSGSNDDFFISVSIDYFNSESNNSSKKLADNIFRENSSHKLLRNQEIADGTYKLKDFRVNVMNDDSYVHFLFRIEDDEEDEL